MIVNGLNLCKKSHHNDLKKKNLLKRIKITKLNSQTTQCLMMKLEGKKNDSCRSEIACQT
jgi:hypothetical protein